MKEGSSWSTSENDSGEFGWTSTQGRTSTSSKSTQLPWKTAMMPPAPPLPSTSSSSSRSSAGAGSDDDDDNDEDDDSGWTSALGNMAAPTGADDGEGGTVFTDGLSFTIDVEQQPCSCDRMDIAFSGGSPPYTVAAFWYLDQNSSVAYWSQIASNTWNSSFSWDSESTGLVITAPGNSSLLFKLSDANGVTVLTSQPIHILPNDDSQIEDTWCRTTGAGTHQVISPAPADWNTTHNLAYNSSDSNNANPTTTTLTKWPKQTEGIAASDNQAIYEQEVSASEHALREIVGALAGVAAAAVLALAALIFLYMRLRRRHRRVLRELDAYKAVGLPPPGGGVVGGKSGKLEKVMSEKPRPQAGNVNNMSSVDLMDTNSDYDIAFELISPTTQGGSTRNPFADPASASSSATAAEAAGLLSARRAHLLSARDKHRLSTTSLVSDVPSAGARSTGAHSAFSTEFYHRAQTRTIPLRRSAGADSDSASGTMSLATTDDGSIETVLVPITRVSTTSSGTRGALSSSGSSTRPADTEDDDEDARSFSNTSYTEPESWITGDDWASRSRTRESNDSRQTAASGFSAWGRRLMGRD